MKAHELLALHAPQAVDCYRESLALIAPLWRGHPAAPRYIARRAAMSLSEVARLHGDVLIGMVLLRAPFTDLAEHSLKVAAVTACVARTMRLPERLCSEVVLCALLHHLGHDSHASAQTTNNKGALAQRSLVTLLSTPTPTINHYRQVLAAFQIDLGMDGAGEPRLSFPVRPHPFSLLLGVCNDFVELVSLDPSRADDAPLSSADALRKLTEQAGRRYHPALVKMLARVVGPLPVSTGLVLRDGRRAVVVRVRLNDNSWSLTAATAPPTSELIEINHTTSSQIQSLVMLPATLAPSAL